MPDIRSGKWLKPEASFYSLSPVQLYLDAFPAIFELSLVSTRLRCLAIRYIYRVVRISTEQLSNLDGPKYSCGGTIRNKITLYSHDVIVESAVPDHLLNTLLVETRNLEYLRQAA